MSEKTSSETITSGSSRPNKVWQLGNLTVHLFKSVAELAAELKYYESSDDGEAAHRAIAGIGDLIETLSTIQKEDELLMYFALAYKERLGGTYVVQDQGKDYVEQRKGDNRPTEVDPLEYRYQSYTDKALDLIEQTLSPISAAGSDLDAAAEAVPYLLDLTFDHSLVKKFVAELRQEAVHAVQLAMSEAGMGMNETCDLDGQKLNGALDGLSGNEVCVLKCMQNRKPALLKIENIMDATHLSRDTVVSVVKDLIEQKLAHRPKGERKGATITDNGLKIAIHINSGSSTLNSL